MAQQSVDLGWLLGLRAVEALAIAGLAALGAGLGWPVSGPAVVLLAALLPASNLLAARRVAANGRGIGGGRAHSDAAGAPALAGALLLLDVAVLTACLALAGGPSNPFTALYLLQVFLAALLTNRAWTIATYAAAASGFALLFVLPIPPTHGLAGHLVGMWVAFAVLGPLLGIAVLALRRKLAAIEAQQRAAEATHQRAQRLASLAALAAGAAHELSTPLATISVVAHELERALRDDLLVDDARLIHDEVERCRGVLEQLAADAGSPRGELARSTSVAAVVRAALGRLGADAARVRVGSLPPEPVVLPHRTVARALRGLVHNALLAAPGPVVLDVSRTTGGLRFSVVDQGSGVTPEVLERLGEPFFSTRAPGEGMGLGVFFARAVAEGTGGRLVVRSTPGRTEAILEIGLGQI